MFDSVAGLYDGTRQGYPTEIVDAIFTTAASGRGAAVLEIGCGTGQLTRQVAGRGLNLTASDIGAAMTETTRRNVADPMARFRACSFEDFPGSGPFDLIVSATAFHWIDPAIAWPKPPGSCGPAAGWPCSPPGSATGSHSGPSCRTCGAGTAARPAKGPGSQPG